MKTGLPSMKSELKPLAKSVLVLLGLTAVASPTDAAGQLEIFGLGMRVLIISNKDIDDLKKIVISINKSGLLI